MAMVANDPAAAKRVGIPQSVGTEFMKADKGRKFKEGGDMKEPKGMMKKEVAFMKKKGAPKSMIKHEMAEAGMKKGGYAKKMMGGGKNGSGGRGGGLGAVGDRHRWRRQRAHPGGVLRQRRHEAQLWSGACLSPVAFWLGGAPGATCHERE